MGELCRFGALLANPRYYKDKIRKTRFLIGMQVGFLVSSQFIGFSYVCGKNYSPYFSCVKTFPNIILGSWRFGTFFRSILTVVTSVYFSFMPLDGRYRKTLQKRTILFWKVFLYLLSDNEGLRSLPRKPPMDSLITWFFSITGVLFYQLPRCLSFLVERVRKLSAMIMWMYQENV